MTRTPATKKPVPKSPLKQRALVVGVSAYPPPLNKLPAVAADVREIAKTLSSRNGVFPAGAVTVLTEKQATRQEVLKALRKAFWGAKPDETIFVYLAGHGGVEKRAYYFLAQDTDPNRLAETGVALSDIKRFFDRTASRRVFLWLDCCHSGGIVARSGSVTADLSTIKREVGVVQGEGKIILAACTANQSAYEDPTIGHGLFTHALLRGIKGGAKGAQGEVTAATLYDFIDREVKDPRQRPVFFGQMTGRIVLMHYPATGSKGSPSATSSKAIRVPAPTEAAPAGRVASSGKNLLLDGHIYAVRSAVERNDASWEVRVVAKNDEQEALLRSLRTDEYRRARPVSFAFGNQGFQVEVDDVTAHTETTSSSWVISLKPTSNSTSYRMEGGYNGLSVEQLAELRARFLLLGEKPESRESRNDEMLLSFVLGDVKDLGLSGAALPVLHKGWKGTSADFLRHARLWLTYYLKMGRVCDDILELSLSARKDGIMVKFRGRRKSRYSGEDAQEIEVQGVCSL